MESCALFTIRKWRLRESKVTVGVIHCGGRGRVLGPRCSSCKASADGPPQMTARLNNFLTLWWRETNTQSVATVLRILNLDLFWGQWYAVVAIAPSWPRLWWGVVGQWHTYDRPVPAQQFCFSLSVEYSLNCMRYSTLRYKRGFALEEFAQLSATLSVLSAFKGGLGSARMCRLGMLHVFSLTYIFSLTIGLT